MHEELQNLGNTNRFAYIVFSANRGVIYGISTPNWTIRRLDHTTGVSQTVRIAIRSQAFGQREEASMVENHGRPLILFRQTLAVQTKRHASSVTQKVTLLSPATYIDRR